MIEITARIWEPGDGAEMAKTTVKLIATEWAGIDLEQARFIELDAGAGEPLIYVSHKRGNNWIATCRGKNAANCDRDFDRYTRRLYDYSSLATGEVIEVGADYTTSGGNKDRWRKYLVVIHVDDERFVFVEYPSLATAMKASRTRRQNIEKTVAEKKAAAAAKRKATLAAKKSA